MGQGDVSDFQASLRYRIKKKPQKRIKGRKENGKKEGRDGWNQKEKNVELEKQGEPKSLQTTGNQEVIKNWPFPISEVTVNR